MSETAAEHDRRRRLAVLELREPKRTVVPRMVALAVVIVAGLATLGLLAILVGVGEGAP